MSEGYIVTSELPGRPIGKKIRTEYDLLRGERKMQILAVLQKVDAGSFVPRGMVFDADTFLMISCSGPGKIFVAIWIPGLRNGCHYDVTR